MKMLWLITICMPKEGKVRRFTHNGSIQNQLSIFSLGARVVDILPKTLPKIILPKTLIQKIKFQFSQSFTPPSQSNIFGLVHTVYCSFLVYILLTKAPSRIDFRFFFKGQGPYICSQRLSKQRLLRRHHDHHFGATSLFSSTLFNVGYYIRLAFLGLMWPAN